MHSNESDFDRRSWHDNLVYGFRLDIGDSFQGDWRSDLVFDIDHIVEWVCGTEEGADGGVHFRVAPATLTFHDASDLRIAVDFGDSGGLTALNELSIDTIAREPAPRPEGYPEWVYFNWRIALNLPHGGEIAFGASGFTQTLRAAPRLLDQQRLPAGTRGSIGTD